jgi:hypothetical protein
MKLLRYFSIALAAFPLVGAWAQATEHNATRDAAAMQAITNINGRVVAVNIPGASAISQVGTFLDNPVPPACAHPIPTLFSSFIQPGAVLDPNRILVGSQSNFGAPLATGVGAEGSFLSIDPSGSGILVVPPHFAHSGVQSSALDGAAQMFSANSPHCPTGTTVSITAVRTLLRTLESATRSVSLTTTPLAASGPPTHHSATAGSVHLRSWIRPGCRSLAPPTH